MAQAQSNTGFANQPPLDVIGLLKGLLSGSDANQAQQQAASLSQQDKTQAQMNAFQEGVMKGLKKTGEQLSSHAVATAGPDIVPHILGQVGLDPVTGQPPGQNLGGGEPPPLTPAGDIRPLIISAPKAPVSQPSQPDVNQPAPQQVDPRVAIQNNILAQLLQQSTPPQGFAGRFGQALNNATGANATQIANLQALLKAAGVTPEQQYQLAGATDLTQSAVGKALANQGQTPIQPYEAASLRAGQNSAQITALKDTMEGLQKRRDDLNTEFEAELKTMTAKGKLFNLTKDQNMTPRMAAIRKEQSGIDRVLAKTQARLSGFTPINPMAAQGNHTPKQIAQYNALRNSGVSADEARQKAGL